MKKTLTLLLVLLCSLGLKAQQLDHVLGELLIRCKEGRNVEALLSKCPTFEGRQTLLRHKKAVSPTLNVHLLQFDHTSIHEGRLLAFLNQQDEVLDIQFNHLIQLRQTIPNDPQFSQQWHWLNNGTNGVADADVDADLAWDITTGGKTTQNDDIVIAVLDDGTETTHPDLQANHWVNTNEIQGNGMDDDNNGYIDDYNGWNANLNNDNVLLGDHGVEVSGMIGAVGNNATGISGINWQVKIMTVKLNTNTGLNEADIIAAYTYPLIMRRMYHNSNGSEGAFVVATNSSWGQDRGQPANAPIWCAIYDTLGSAGIINIAATTNQNNNVDIVGDLPTTCPSEYLVGVGSTNFSDVLEGGFGPIHVDLAAPGINVLTTSRGANYRTVQGTSYATPLVAGIVGLMYAVPCNNLIELAKTDPSGAALVIRDYLLSSVDPIGNLSNLVNTGGRANAHSTLQTIIQNCGSCPPPLALRSTAITGTEAQLSWFSADATQSNNLRWRKKGTSNWTNVSNASNPYSLSSIEACTDYEWQVLAVCSGESSAYASLASFKTDGCCLPPASLTITAVTNTTAQANWPSVLAAQRYEIRIRLEGGGWSQSSTTTNSFTFTSLMDCSPYEAQVRTVCDTGATAYIPIRSFRTTGCGNCIDLIYCDGSGANTQSEWIESVELDQINNVSGNNDGYLLVPSTNAVLEAGSSYPIKLSPGYAGSNFTEIFRVWIDFNQDGDFGEMDELVFTSLEVDGPTEGTIIIPPSATEGITRMRVAMKFNAAPELCEEIDFGEVEDYCVTIEGNSGCFAPTANVTPEQGSGFAASVEVISLPLAASTYSLRFRKIGGSNWTIIEDTDANEQTVLISRGLDFCTNYELQLQSNCNGTLSVWGNSIHFATLGCGACLDLEYCETNGNSSSFEYLQSVQFNEIDNNSGNNNGYGDFTNTSITTSLQAGSTYELVLSPFYPFDPFDVVYRVWIDYRQDGDLDDANELVFDSGLTNSAEIRTNITIPTSALSGFTRLRISIREREAPGNCGSFPFGEVEDYCITIINSADCQTPTLSVDQITSTTANLSWTSQPQVTAYDIQHRVTGTFDWEESTYSEASATLMGLDSCQEYEVRIRAVCNTNLNSLFSQTTLFNTDCSTATQSPGDLKQLQLFPNPFSQELTISFELLKAGRLQIDLFTIDGKMLSSEVNSHVMAGLQQFKLAADSPWPRGVLLLRIQTAEGVVLKKVIRH